jgi:RimJ/RimL family protein N-acetyltransferase
MTRLRPTAPEGAETLEQHHAGPDEAGAHCWSGFRPAGHVQQRFDDRTLLSDRGHLAVVDDADHLVADVGWSKVNNGPPPHGECRNLGIWVVAEHRGQSHGTEAQRLGAAYLLDHTTRERLEAGTESGNLAEQRALEKTGFAREGPLRRACLRSGELRDMVLYPKLRGEK